MPDSPAADLLDDRLRAVARALADEAPPTPDSLDALRSGAGPAGARATALPERSGPARRRPHLLVAAATVAVAGLAGAAVLVADDGPAELEAGMSPPEAPQRLSVPGWPGEIVVDDDGTVHAEPLPTAGFDPVLLDGPARLTDDGRTVAVGAVPGPDGTEEGLTHVLRVAGEDGTVEVERTLDDGDDGQPFLLAATDEVAYLVREDDPMTVAVVDLATGEERDSWLAFGWPYAGEVSDRLYLAEASPLEGEASDCWIEAITLDGEVSTSIELHRACAVMHDVQPSPDGRRLAVAYETHTGTGTEGTTPGGTGAELRVAVIDLAWAGSVDDGLAEAVVSDNPLGHPVVCEPGSAACDGVVPRSYLGMAWQDDATLRVATVDLATQPDFDVEGGAPDPEAVVVTDLAIPQG